MPVPSLVTDLSTTAASNSPAGSDNVFPDLDNYLRAMSAFIASIRDNSGNGWVSPYLPLAGGTVTGATTFSNTVTGTKFIPTGTSATGNGMYLPATNTLGFSTNGAEVARLDSSGNLGLGVTPSATQASYRSMELFGSIWMGGNGTAPATYSMTNTYFDGAYKYKTTGYAATYYGQYSGTHNWFTAPSGTAGDTISFTQAMTLDASGNLLVGTTTTSGGRATISAVANYNDLATGDTLVLVNTPGTGSVSNPVNVGVIQFGNPTLTNSNIGRISVVQENPGGSTAGSMRFFTNSGGGNTATLERARITSGGDLLVSKTTANLDADPGIELLETGRLSPVVDNSVCMFVSRLTAGGDMITFRVAGSNAASITATTTSVSYNTSSDRRLKKDITPAPQAGADIDAIEIVSHGWIKNDAVVKYGVIAQDLNAIAPAAVTAGDDGDDVEQPWGVDYSKLVPMLIKEVQSLRARVAALEAA